MKSNLRNEIKSYIVRQGMTMYSTKIYAILEGDFVYRICALFIDTYRRLC